MKLDLVASLIRNIPHMSVEQGRIVYDFVLNNKITNALELGFAHGTSSCYIAAAMDERKVGLLTTIDLKYAINRDPNIHILLKKTGLEQYIQPIFVETSYNWEMMRMIEEQTHNDVCEPIFDFCFIDGAHTWNDDGLAFTLADKLLKSEGWILFDDLDWTYANSPTMANLDWVKKLPDVQRKTPQIKKVFDLLVRQHPSYDRFQVVGNWGWAHKK